ncbi:unnamed protein product [Mesocestoides corti]|uniref:Uncharacterized protein n=1 Tax=Mesocestoides corti TaxID=53468 RepID=A0A0R3UID8_MESCO|nr:unnamed protein product [Mesocestoides corti]
MKCLCTLNNHPLVSAAPPRTIHSVLHPPNQPSRRTWPLQTRCIHAPINCFMVNERSCVSRLFAFSRLSKCISVAPQVDRCLSHKRHLTTTLDFTTSVGITMVGMIMMATCVCPVNTPVCSQIHTPPEHSSTMCALKPTNACGGGGLVPLHNQHMTPSHAYPQNALQLVAPRTRENSLHIDRITSQTARSRDSS